MTDIFDRRWAHEIWMHDENDKMVNFLLAKHKLSQKDAQEIYEIRTNEIECGGDEPTQALLAFEKDLRARMLTIIKKYPGLEMTDAKILGSLMHHKEHMLEFLKKKYNQSQQDKSEE